MAHEIVFSPEARADLQGLYSYIAERAGNEIALRYVERIEAHCRTFATFPQRGTRRDDLGEGVRITGFAGRIALVFRADERQVAFLRILYGGRSLELLRKP